MDGIKAKLNAMREQLAAAEKREELARMRTRNERERIARAEDEKAAKARKISILQLNLTRTEDQTDSKLDRLECLQKHIHENETCRRQLERKEMKEDNTLSHLESRQKSRRIYADESEQRYREACNKLSMLEARNAKVDAKLQTAKSNERYFEGRLNDAGRTACSLARSGESKQARCDEYREKCRHLEERKDRVLISAECLERKAGQLESRLTPLRAETKEQKQLELKAKRELRDLLDEMNTYP